VSHLNAANGRARYGITIWSNVLNLEGDAAVDGQIRKLGNRLKALKNFRVDQWSLCRG